MVYKIRNKGFYQTWGGQSSHRIFVNKKTKMHADMSIHVTLQTHITRYTQLRIMHNYRNISRACKQFMMGDKFLERIMILTLKEMYFQPMRFRAPIENTFFLVSSTSLILTGP